MNNNIWSVFHVINVRFHPFLNVLKRNVFESKKYDSETIITNLFSIKNIQTLGSYPSNAVPLFLGIHTLLQPRVLAIGKVATEFDWFVTLELSTCVKILLVVGFYWCGFPLLITELMLRESAQTCVHIRLLMRSAEALRSGKLFSICPNIFSLEELLLRLNLWPGECFVLKMWRDEG